MSETRFSVRPLPVGAEIVGLSAEIEVDEELRAGLYAAWLEHGVLLFHDIQSIEHHLAISRSFGELELHPLAHVRADEEPLLMEVSGKNSRPWVYDEVNLKVNTIPWHRDTAYTPNLAKGAMLRMLVTPAVGGETFFADTAKAYDELPERLQARLVGLEWRSVFRHSPMEQTGPGALWESVRPLSEDEYTAAGVEPVEPGLNTFLPPVVHPALLVHPESGRRCVFLSPKEFDGFLGVERSASDELFEQLVSHLLQDRYVYAHHWAVNDAIVWDNRRFMHAAAGNPLGERRRGLRTTLAGELCVGRLEAGAAK